MQITCRIVHGRGHGSRVPHFPRLWISWALAAPCPLFIPAQRSPELSRRPHGSPTKRTRNKGSGQRTSRGLDGGLPLIARARVTPPKTRLPGTTVSSPVLSRVLIPDEADANGRALLARPCLRSVALKEIRLEPRRGSGFCAEGEPKLVQGGIGLRLSPATEEALGALQALEDAKKFFFEVRARVRALQALRALTRGGGLLDERDPGF